MYFVNVYILKNYQKKKKKEEEEEEEKERNSNEKVFRLRALGL